MADDDQKDEASRTGSGDGSGGASTVVSSVSTVRRSAGRGKPRVPPKASDLPGQVAAMSITPSAPGAGSVPAVQSTGAVPASPAGAVAAATGVGGAGSVRRSIGRGKPRSMQKEPSSLSEISHATGSVSDERKSAGRGIAPAPKREHVPQTWPKPGFCKQSDIGVKCRLVSNYFAVKHNPNMIMYQYHVTFTPEVESIFMRKSMMFAHRDIIGQQVIFDGMALWSFMKLDSEVTEFFSTRSTDNAHIKIEVRLIRDVSSRDPVILQILNSQMRKNFASMGFKLIGKNYFDCRDSRTIETHNLELIPGFATAIHQYENSVLMNCDLSFKVIRRDTVVQLMHELYRQDPCYFRENSEKKLLGEIVLTNYNNKTYKIDEIKWDEHPTSTFHKKDGTTTNFITYMYQTWNLTVKDPRQPMLLSKPKARDVRRGDTRPILLIPEFCIITGLDEETRADFSVMKAIANHTRVEPTERARNLLGFLNRIKTTQQVQKEMKEWGLAFSNCLHDVQGKSLPPEGIILSCDKNDRGAQYDIREADWSRLLRGKRLLEPVRLTNWLMVYFTRDQRCATDLVAKLKEVCPSMGIVISNPTLVVCANDRTQTFLQRISQSMSEDLTMIVVVAPNNRKERYDAIKKMCCVEYGIPSQVVVSRTLNKANTIRSIATKIAIQMNCKLGGQAWRVNVQLPGTMIVGIDVYRDTSQKNVSVCGVVCSTNDYMTKYHSQVAFQARAQAMSDVLVTQLSVAIKQNSESNKKLPDRIIIYRDGVGDGQVNHVKEWEVKQIMEAFEAQGPNYNPEVIFVIVNKTPRTRLFKPSGGSGYESRGGSTASSYGGRGASFSASSGARSKVPSDPRGSGDPSSDVVAALHEDYGNPYAGTIVDTEITRPDRFDFFLISQSVRQGTVAPTYYNVIYTSSNLPAGRLQLLTYQLCHLYYNWQGCIRVPAPTQYANKLAFLVGQSLHTVPSEALADTLYYL